MVFVKLHFAWKRTVRKHAPWPSQTVALIDRASPEHPSTQSEYESNCKYPFHDGGRGWLDFSLSDCRFVSSGTRLHVAVGCEWEKQSSGQSGYNSGHFSATVLLDGLQCRRKAR